MRLLLITMTVAGSILAQPVVVEQDPVLSLARVAASEYGASLPNYVCQETLERYGVIGSARTPPKHEDTVQAEVVYEAGKEEFRNLRVDGKPVEKLVGGIWSVGVFGPMMASLFEPRLAAAFVRRGKAREAGRDVVRYDFRVAEEKSNWIVSAGTQAKPGYKGSVWVEAATGRVLRHEMETLNMPRAFYYQGASLKLRYRFVTINGTEYLLPQKMESALCPRNFIYCDRIEATYSGCHKFATESSLKFDAE